MTPRALARFWPLLGSLVLAAACGPFVILEETGSESTEMGDETEDATPPPVTTSTSTSTTSTSTSTTTTGDPTGNGPGYCVQTCNDVLDCPPGDSECIDGFCEYVGEIPPCDPALCDDLMIGFCTEVDGVSLCATWCTDDSMCVPGFTECTGQDDAGNAICAQVPCIGAAEGEPCEIIGFGQLGVCTDGECTCTDDSECTAEGFVCRG